MKFAVEGVPYQVHQDGRKVVFENKYTCFVHDLDQGGELSDARVINGSNANLLAAELHWLAGTQSLHCFQQFEFSGRRCGNLSRRRTLRLDFYAKIA